MENTDKALAHLASAIRTIKQLLAWQALKQAEHRKSPLNLPDHTEEQLHNECMFAEYTIERLEQALSADHPLLPDRQKHSKRLTTLKRQYQQLASGPCRYPKTYTAGL